MILLSESDRKEKLVLRLSPKYYNMLTNLNFRICQSLTNTCIRHIHTNVSRTLFKNEFKPIQKQNKRTTSTLLYTTGLGILCVGLTYAAVPLYRIFCQSYSYGGSVATHDPEKVGSLKANRNRIITVKFNADTGAAMAWNFHPQQTEIKVMPGETALAFYTATNPTDEPVIGVSTYNVVPFEAGQYFNKIQCFCFEEQMLNPHEQVDMPVFFYIDPEYAEDPQLELNNDIVLSYTFFEAKEGMNLPIPSFVRARLSSQE